MFSNFMHNLLQNLFVTTAKLDGGLSDQAAINVCKVHSILIIKTLMMLIYERASHWKLARMMATTLITL